MFAIVAVNRVNLGPDSAYPWINQYQTMQVHTWNLIPLHSHWDSDSFLSIAHTGYSYDASGKSGLSNIAFFPLYPILIKIFGSILANFQLAGFLLSSLSAVLACGVLYKLVQKYHVTSSPTLAVMFMLIFPTAFFLNGVYSEALFLFLSIVFFYYLFEKKFWIAGLIGFLAALTRITGLFLFLPFLFELIVLYRAKQIKVQKLSLSLLIPPGTALFFLYHQIRFGSFLLYFKVQADWGRTFALNTNHLYFGSPAGIINTSLDILFALLGIALSILVYKRVKKSYALYMISAIIAALATGTLMSIGRIILVFFPMYILLGQIKNEKAKFAWALPSILLLGLYTLLFVNYYWAG